MAARKLTKERRLANCQRRASYCFGSQTSPNKIVADRLTCVYLKELASLVQAHDLEKKIEAESKIREKAQNVFYQSTMGDYQFYEAVKQSFVSDQRMIAYKEELNRRRSRDCQDFAKQALSPSPAKLVISGLRIPLIWKGKDHFQNRGDSRRFAFLAVFRIGAEIRDTHLLFNVDRTCTDLSFNDICLFEEVSFNFLLHLSLYSCLLDDGQGPVASIRLKQKLRTSLPRSWNAKFSTNSSQKHFIEKVKFDLIASSTLSVKDADGPVKTFDLKLRNMGNSLNNPPIYNNFCCNLVLQPTSVLKSLQEGVLTVQTPEITLQGVYCRLKNSYFNVWQTQKDVLLTRPILSILLPENTAVEQSRRKNSVIIRLPQQNRFKQCSISTNSEEEILNWKNAFDQQLLDHKLWGKFAELQLPLFSPVSSTGCQNFGGKTLYELVSVDASDSYGSSFEYDKCFSRHLQRPNITKLGPADTVTKQKRISYQPEQTFVSYLNENFEHEEQKSFNTTVDEGQQVQQRTTSLSSANSSRLIHSNVTVRPPLCNQNDRESEL